MDVKGIQVKQEDDELTFTDNVCDIKNEADVECSSALYGVDRVDSDYGQYVPGVQEVWIVIKIEPSDEACINDDIAIHDGLTNSYQSAGTDVSSLELATDTNGMFSASNATDETSVTHRTHLQDEHDTLTQERRLQKSDNHSSELVIDKIFSFGDSPTVIGQGGRITELPPSAFRQLSDCYWVFPCMICRLLFGCKEDLLEHWGDVHDIERLYVKEASSIVRTRYKHRSQLAKTRTYLCYFCDSIFSHIASCIKHMLSHEVEISLRSEHRRTASSHEQQDLAEHADGCSGEPEPKPKSKNSLAARLARKRFKCKGCSDKFFDLPNLYHHLVKRHKTELSDVMRQQPAESTKKMSRNKSRCDDDASTNQTTVPNREDCKTTVIKRRFLCKSCPAHFVELRELDEHLTKEHTSESGGPTKPAHTSSDTDKENKFCCRQCHSVLETKTLLQWHEEHHRFETFQEREGHNAVAV